MNTTKTLKEIGEHIGGDVEGDGATLITGVSSLTEAGPSDISFCSSRKHLADLATTRAGAVVIGPVLQQRDGLPALRCPLANLAWARVVKLFHSHARNFSSVSPAAYLGDDVEFGEGVGVGPGAYIGNRVRIGAGSEIFPCCSIGDDTVIGENTRLYCGVHVYHSCSIGSRVILHSGVIVGADGYGYAQAPDSDPAEPLRHEKIPQVGAVIIEDDVEIGANTTIDRGALQSTVIKHGVKIDNLVMVAHNCEVGVHSLLIGQSGLSGSVHLGPYVTVAGQSGIAGHLKVGAGATIGARTGIMKDVPAGETHMGSPALPAGQARRAYSQIEHLPEFRRTIQDLEKRVVELEGGSESP